MVHVLFAGVCVSGRSLNAREALLYEYTHEAEGLKDSVFSQTEKVKLALFCVCRGAAYTLDTHRDCLLP